MVQNTKSFKTLLIMFLLVIPILVVGCNGDKQKTDSGPIGASDTPPQSGEIIGTVSRADGSAIPGVSVEVTSINLIGKKMVVTGYNGTYRLQGLPTGSYKAVYTQEGFQTVTKTGITVDSGLTYKLDVIMRQ
ncbi:MAG: carboxypeptidase regulatory-like domain-containing protein [bacterium]|nr:carboxypeptidase regulatory-like domain-containing protein [bacterium]